MGVLWVSVWCTIMYSIHRMDGVVLTVLFLAWCMSLLNFFTVHYFCSTTKFIVHCTFLDQLSCTCIPLVGYYCLSCVELFFPAVEVGVETCWCCGGVLSALVWELCEGFG